MAGVMIGPAILLLVMAAMYFMPTIIAFLRKHRQTAAIAAVNVLLGWTVVGWIVSFIWSLTSGSATAPQTIIVQNTAAVAPPALQPRQPADTSS
ncbi:MAG: superinfection immunity protein [Caulobacteraceae bacterium]|nr:superinfection immunity protein [Caulobacteraceae bacterium]